MKGHHWNIAKIARDAGLKYAAVYSYITQRREPKFEQIAALAAVTGVEPMVWLKGDVQEIRAALDAAFSRKASEPSPLAVNS